MEEYKKRVENEINHYKELDKLVPLPNIYNYWNKKYVLPKFINVFGENNHINLYINSFINVMKNRQDKFHYFLSIGSGECKIEIEIAKQMILYGFKEFCFIVTELSEYRINRARMNIDNEGLSGYFTIKEVDWNSTYENVSMSYSGVMAQHTLHHIVELEKLFEFLNESLIDEGVFVIIDMIGRNGHMRWPEVLVYVEKIWSILPAKFKYNHQFKKVHDHFINWDCSVSGFEGIRAQEILPLLCENFDFTHFLGVGGLIDIFIDKGFGHNFDLNNEIDLFIIDLIEMFNDQLLENSIIKPTIAFGVVKKKGYGFQKERFYGNLSSRNSIRIV